MTVSIGRRRFLGAVGAVGAVGGVALLGCAPGSREAGASGFQEAGATGANAAAELGSDPAGASASQPGRLLDRWGVQLYTVREEMAADPDATLAAVAAIGYAEVEFAGLHGIAPRTMRSKLDALGLRAVSSHLSLGDVRGDWAAHVADAVELGQSLVVVPSLPGDERTPDGLRRIAADFNRAGEAARAGGVRFGYHNHDWEFGALSDGTVPMELLLERTDPDLVDWQMDIFWVLQGGGDPAADLSRHGHRVTSVHVKDRSASGEMVDVGDGVVDFGALIRLGSEMSLQHAFVEHDRPDDPMTSIRRGFTHLSSIAV